MLTDITVIDDILMRVGVTNNPSLRIFLKQSQEYMSKSGIDSLRQCIIAREKQLKGARRAKTAHPGEFSPEEWFWGGELDYRFTNARMLLRDIMMKEENNA